MTTKTPTETPTEDPLSHAQDHETLTAEPPTLEILFHSDLRRVGEFLWPPLTSRTTELILGRESPSFARPGAGTALPLLDPCISRRQLSLRWEEEGFLVQAHPEARRGLRILDPQGVELAGPACPPGSLLLLGNRVMLRVRRGMPAVLPGVVGSSAAVDRMAILVRAVAPRSEPTLILGETGVGKELIARAIHALSPRSAGPFVAINCAALPETLAESELFGHVKGAFSGATTARPGLFRRAHGGTLFLDEVGELSLALQAKLLRALELGVVRPVGSDTDIPVDTRILAATHRSLEQRIQEQTFREDLLARLDRLRVEVPPLRERLPDVPLLFAHHLLLAAGSPEQAPWLIRQATSNAPPVPLEYVLELMRYPWPRNVRELQKVALAVVTQGTVTGRFVAPSALLSAQPTASVDASPPPSASPLPPSTATPPPEPSSPPSPPDAATLRRLLEEHGHVQLRVARALGVPYATLDRWLQREGILRPRDLDEAILRAALSGAATLPEAARKLGISERGLRLRMIDLGLLKPGSG